MTIDFEKQLKDLEDLWRRQWHLGILMGFILGLLLFRPLEILFGLLIAQ